MNLLTRLKFRVRAKKIPGPILIDPGMSHFYPQDPAKAPSVREGFNETSVKSRFSPNFRVMLKFQSSKYSMYSCG
jgi:hypothetical protein